MPYEIIIERTARKALNAIQRADQIAIATAIADLADDPRPTGCIKMKGREAWRIRVGDYRVIYEIEDEILIISVVTIGHRREVYKK